LRCYAAFKGCGSEQILPSQPGGDLMQREGYRTKLGNPDDVAAMPDGYPVDTKRRT
jgi:hypothetical protein